MKRTAWYRPDQVPAWRGWYERDHRKVREYQNPADRHISLDLWEPVPDPMDILYPGVWYVNEPGRYLNYITHEYEYRAECINDASQQNLPWRGLTKPA